MSPYLARDLRALRHVRATRVLRKAIRHSRRYADTGNAVAARRWWRTAERLSLRCGGCSGPLADCVVIDRGRGGNAYVAWSPVPIRENAA